MVSFPFGVPVVLLRRNTDGSFAAAEVIRGCAVAPREQGESPVPSWPPVTSGRTVYAPPGTVVAARDRMVAQGVTFEVDGDPQVWNSPFTGVKHGVVINLRRADNWFDTTVTVKTYLGSSGFGGSWAGSVEWPANLVSVESLNASGSGDESDTKFTVRVPPTNEDVPAVEVFTPGSVLTVAGVDSTVVSVAPITRDGFTEYVEVSAS